MSSEVVASGAESAAVMRPAQRSLPWPLSGCRRGVSSAKGRHARRGPGETLLSKGRLACDAVEIKSGPSAGVGSSRRRSSFPLSGSRGPIVALDWTPGRPAVCVLCLSSARHGATLARSSLRSFWSGGPAGWVDTLAWTEKGRADRTDAQPGGCPLTGKRIHSDERSHRGTFLPSAVPWRFHRERDDDAAWRE